MKIILSHAKPQCQHVKDGQCEHCKNFRSVEGNKKRLTDRPFEILNWIFYPRNIDRTPENFSWPTERVIAHGQR